MVVQILGDAMKVFKNMIPYLAGIILSLIHI